MTLSQIKEAIAEGKLVHWSNDSYRVIKHRVFEDHYLIRCLANNACTGLEYKGTLQGDEKDFYVKDIK